MRSRILIPVGMALALMVVVAPVEANKTAHHQRANVSRGSSTVKFGSPSIVDPIHSYGEPDYKISPLDGAAYASGPWGTGTQRSIWNRSTDGGQTFLSMHNPPIASSSESATTIAGPGGGDTEIMVDHTGKVYYADLAALASLKMATWENSRCEDGCPDDTLKTQTIANPPQNINGYDRQWFALWDPKDPQAVRDATGYTGPFPVNYLLFAEALAGSSCPSGSCESASYSTDGLTYTDSTMSYDMQNDGPLVIEQSTGTVIEGISVDSLNDVGVAISTRDPANPADPALKNTRIVKVATLPANMTDRALFPVPALDNAGNLYVIWVTRSDELAKDNSKAWQIWYSWSKKSSNWTEWSDPIQVSQPPSNTNVMPWATAGSGGRLAVVWYGTDDDSHNPSTEGAHQKWDVYLNVITNAASNSPKLHQQKVTRHPMHYGTVCLEGTGCIAVQGNRNVADFFEVVTDPRTGRIAVVYDDTSNDITQTVANGQQVGDSAADHKGAPLVTVALQNGGIGLLGKRIHGPPRGGTKMRDRKDDATWDPIYGADTVPQLDLRNVSIKRMKKSFRVKLKVGQLSDFNTALTTTGSVAMNYVVRWSGKKKTAEGIKNPIYYAAAEATAGDSVQYYAGDAFTYELCSVSGCFPHGFLYPAPPLGGTAIKGKLVDKKGKKPDLFKLKIPFSVVGKRKLLESFSAYAIASPRSAGTPPSNSEAEADRMPVLVDGICCRDAKPRLRRRH